MRIEKKVTNFHIREEMVRRLENTDGYAIRKSESGKKIPKDILVYRTKVRQVSDDMKNMNRKPFDFASDHHWPEEPR